MTQMFPQFDETDVEREQHDDNGGTAEYKEKVVQLLLRPLHLLLKLCRQSSCRKLRDDD